MQMSKAQEREKQMLRCWMVSDFLEWLRQEKAGQ